MERLAVKPNIEIHYNKPQVFLQPAINILFYCAILYGIRQDGLNSFLIGLLVVLSFHTLYLIIKRIVPAINNKIMIEITPYGVVDNLHNRKLYWENIDSMNYRMGTQASSGVVILNVRNPRSYYSGSPFGLLQYWFSKIYNGYPIVIKTRSLDIGTKELFDKISEHFDQEIKKSK